LYVDPPVPTGIDYVLLDMRNAWNVSGISWFRKLRNIQRQAESIPNLHLVKAEDGVRALLARGEITRRTQSLVERDLPPETVLHAPVDLGRGVTIAGYVTEVGAAEQPRSTVDVHVTIFSSVRSARATDLAALDVSFTLQRSKTRT
jgi:hypothetical protein